MANIVYTIVNDCRLVVLEQGNLNMPLMNWLQRQNNLSVNQCSFITTFLAMAGFSCKIDFYYSSFLVNVRGEPSYGGCGSTPDVALKMLNSVIPGPIRSLIKHPDKSPEARKARDAYFKGIHTPPCSTSFVKQPYV